MVWAFEDLKRRSSRGEALLTATARAMIVFLVVVVRRIKLKTSTSRNKSNLIVLLKCKRAPKRERSCKNFN